MMQNSSSCSHNFLANVHDFTTTTPPPVESKIPNSKENHLVKRLYKDHLLDSGIITQNPALWGQSKI